MPTYFTHSTPRPSDAWEVSDQAEETRVSPVKRISAPPRQPSSDKPCPRPPRATNSSTSAAVDVASASRSGASAGNHSAGATYVSAQNATSAANASESTALSPPSRSRIPVTPGGEAEAGAVPGATANPFEDLREPSPAPREFLPEPYRHPVSTAPMSGPAPQ